jgi:hypothetical protein
MLPLKFQEALAYKYNYCKLPDKLSKEARQLYLENLPPGLLLNGDPERKIYSKNKTLIAIGYDRIVIGDYGAFIEFNFNQIVFNNLIIKPGEEYRINDEKYKNHVKYVWLTTIDNSNIKIYYQKRKVSYADYKRGKYYVSPYEVVIE